MEKLTESKIIGEIKETGFPLELKVGKCFKKLNWNNTQYNKYYLDYDEQKGREIDICAYDSVVKEIAEGENLVIGLHLIIEVKHTSCKPWVIFTTEQHFFEAISGYWRIYYDNNINLKAYLSQEEIEQDSGLITNTNLGRSYCEITEKGKKTNIFDSLTKVIKASEYILEENKKASDSLNKDGPRKEKGIFFIEPLVILNDGLYEAFLNDKDEIEIKETNKITVTFNYKSPSYQRYNYAIQIMTLSELPNYISLKNKWLDNLSKISSEKIKTESLPNSTNQVTK